MTVLDLFAGPGGWDVAARDLGLDPIGVEIDFAPCRTGRAAGFTRVAADVADLDPAKFLAELGADEVEGLIASPSCRGFTMTGHGRGRAGSAALLAAVARIASGEDARAVIAEVDATLGDTDAALVLEPLRWALDLRPRWIALEQVPPVLPLWQAIAVALGAHGWHTATGVLSAEEYGVPQTRKRAVLLAHRDRRVSMPAPTHRPYLKGVGQDEGDPALAPWVAMSDVLGEVSGSTLRSNYGTGGDAANRGTREADEPAPTVTSKVDRNTWVATSSTRPNAPRRALGEPSATVAFGHDSASFSFLPADADDVAAAKADGRARRISTSEAGLLQSFPADYPWQGTTSERYQQIGDAVPPLLARAVLAQVVGS